MTEKPSPAMNQLRREALMKEYGEVTSSFRMLTDIRFKLLAFLPIAAGAATALKSDSPSPIQFALSCFGLVVTIGLITYNERNDQLYGDLVGRAGIIERSLGLVDESFANRQAPWLTFRFLPASKFLEKFVAWKIDHGTGIAAIYSACIGLWLYGMLVPLVEFCRMLYLRARLPAIAVAQPAIGVNLLALILAGLVVLMANLWIKNQRQKREKKMRLLAREAVEKVLATEYPDLVRICAELAERDLAKVQARLEFYLVKLAPESQSFYLPAEPKEIRAAHLVALLSGMTPAWIFDCYTNRSGDA